MPCRAGLLGMDSLTLSMSSVVLLLPPLLENMFPKCRTLGGWVCSAFFFQCFGVGASLSSLPRCFDRKSDVLLTHAPCHLCVTSALLCAIHTNLCSLVSPTCVPVPLHAPCAGSRAAFSCRLSRWFQEIDSEASEVLACDWYSLRFWGLWVRNSSIKLENIEAIISSNIFPFYVPCRLPLHAA